MDERKKEVAYAEEQLRRTAYHELGHAVTAIVLGSAVAEVAIDSGVDRAGFTIGGFPTEIPEDEAAKRGAVIAVAGLAAELILMGQQAVDFSKDSLGLK